VPADNDSVAAAQSAATNVGILLYAIGVIRALRAKTVTTGSTTGVLVCGDGRNIPAHDNQFRLRIGRLIAATGRWSGTRQHTSGQVGAQHLF